jgi:hypothetical protein
MYALSVVARAIVVLALAVSTAVTVSCAQRTVGDAERDGDVAWLDANGSQEAVAALGRLADNSPKAVDMLNARASRDVAAYVAAWNATVRGAAWGPPLLKTGLGDPARAEEAASVMGRKDGHLLPFLPELEAALAWTTRRREGPSVEASDPRMPAQTQGASSCAWPQSRETTRPASRPS